MFLFLILQYCLAANCSPAGRSILWVTHDRPKMFSFINKLYLRGTKDSGLMSGFFYDQENGCVMSGDDDKQNEERYLVDGVPVQAMPCGTELTETQVGNSSTMSFNLQTSGLAVQIQTTTPVNLQVADLTSKLELVVFKLSETEQRLDAAMRQIGFLEAQLEYKSAEVTVLSTKLLTLQV
jgi:hypothetical protein